MPATRSKTLWSFAIALAVLALWIASLFVTLSVAPAEDWAVGVGYGSLWLEHPVLGDNSAGTWLVRTDSCTITVWPGWDFGTDFNDWYFPLWPFVTFAAWRAVRSVRQGGDTSRCAACGYSREGLDKASVCPECGVRPALGIEKEDRVV